MNFLLANRIAPDGTPQGVAFHLRLFCLPMSDKKDARLNVLTCFHLSVGQSLFLGDVSNGNVYESRGSNSGQGYMFLPIRNRNNSHIMLGSFHHIELRKTKNPPCRITSGKNI